MAQTNRGANELGQLCARIEHLAQIRKWTSSDARTRDQHRANCLKNWSSRFASSCSGKAPPVRTTAVELLEAKPAATPPEDQTLDNGTRTPDSSI